MSAFVQIPPTALGIALAAAIVVLALASLVCLLRAALGPAPADRLAGLALATMNAVAILALLAVARADWRYLDIALVLSVLFGALPIALGRLSRRQGTPRAELEEKGASHVAAD